MIRLTFEFEHMSPFLRVCAGQIHVEKMDNTISNPPIELFRVKFEKQPGTTGYSSIDGDGIPSKLFQCLKPVIDAKLCGYWNGMILSKDDYQWVPMEGDESWKDLMNLEEEVEKYIERLKHGDTEEDILTEWKEGSSI